MIPGMATFSANKTAEFRRKSETDYTDLKYVLTCIDEACESGYYHTNIHLTPCQKISLLALGYEIRELVGNSEIRWGKD
jgi:hypothetical protein